MNPEIPFSEENELTSEIGSFIAHEFYSIVNGKEEGVSGRP